MEKEVSFKIVLRGGSRTTKGEDEIRRFSTSNVPSLFTFWSLLADLFKNHPMFHMELRLSYLDSEGDEVNVVTEEEWNEASHLFTKNASMPAKLFLAESYPFFQKGLLEGGGFYHGGSILGQYVLFEKSMENDGERWVRTKHTLSVKKTAEPSQLLVVLDGIEFSSNARALSSSCTVLQWNSNVLRITTCGLWEHTRFSKGFVDVRGDLLEGYIDGFEIRGIRIPMPQEHVPLPPQDMNKLSEYIPKILIALGPHGHSSSSASLVPYRLPEWLFQSGAVRLIPLQTNGFAPEMDLDVDIPRLIGALHSHVVQLLDAKNYAEAEKVLELLEWVDAASPILHYNRACTFALTGRGDQAMASLRYAVECGYRNSKHMQQDPDLESIKTRYLTSKNKIRQLAGDVLI